jgi:putative two-component system hydrogenase maturation factor HypX/HoxX
MRIVLLISAFNALSQRIFCELKALKHEVHICLSYEKNLLEQIQQIEPEIIFCPYLKEYLFQEIYDAYPTFIVHPGPIGDRGYQSLDYAIKQHKQQWGVVILKANKELDAGDIFASCDFGMRQASKASLYRNEVCDAASSALKQLLQNVHNTNFKPTKQILNALHLPLTQEERQINWEYDDTQTIIKKINMSDSYPGVKENLLGCECYLFGVHKEAKLKGKPKEILAKRDGSICIASIDGAVWISHLKKPSGYKLPATYVLKERLKGVKELRIPLVLEKRQETFYELFVEYKNEVAYLYFDFYNGAMSAQQAIRLRYAIDYVKQNCKVLVLMGGEEFFCNGIHLHILEQSKKQGEDGWSNINAINDVVRSTLFAEDIITVASFGKNAGAGGVFLGLACDYVVAKQGVVLNPHYKTMGLSGSEYHSFSFYKKVECKTANDILQKALPIEAKTALDIGLCDAVFEAKTYENKLEKFCQTLIADEIEYETFIDNKKDFLFENEEKIEALKEEELHKMYPQFWDEKSSFHTLRKAFILKKESGENLKRLKELGHA